MAADVEQISLVVDRAADATDCMGLLDHPDGQTARGGEMPGEADPLTLPPGFELVLDQTRLGSLRLVVAR